MDVSLVKGDLKIACEIAVSNSVEYEVKNIEKCLNAGYSFVCVVSKDENHLERIKERSSEISGNEKVRWFKVDQLIEFLDSLSVEKNPVERIRGYRVSVNYISKDT